LRLYLEESGDEVSDQERLNRVFDLLRSTPGEDAVVLTVLTQEGDEVDLALPSASLDETLVRRLREALAAGAARPAPA
jgi:hypothetical protein